MILTKLRDLFREVLDMDEESFSSELRLGDHPNWDSLQHFKLICAVEETFQIRFLSNEIEGMQSVEDIYKMIEEKLK